MMLNHTVIPDGHPLKMNTAALGLLFPGALTQFKNDENVDIQVEVRAIKNF